MKDLKNISDQIDTLARRTSGLNLKIMDELVFNGKFLKLETKELQIMLVDITPKWKTLDDASSYYYHRSLEITAQ